MIKSIHIKSEFKKIFREPIMILLFLAPLIIPVIFKLIITFLLPIAEQYTSFTFLLYQHYFLSFVLMLNPMLLSIIIGFSMIDDRDSKITELISVTPMSKSGYLFMRLSLVFVFVILYTVYSYILLGIYIIPVFTLLCVILLLCIYSAVMGLLLFSAATDKVNGLTYAKGLNIIMLFAFADLLNIKWVNILGSFFPPFWLTRIIAGPGNAVSILSGIAVSSIWLAVLLFKTKF